VAPEVAIAAGMALAFAAVHLFGRRLAFLDVQPRSRWLSLAGGVSIAYVFIHLLPELTAAQETFADEAGGVIPFIEHHAFLVALFGLALFYGMERLVSLRVQPRRCGAPPDPMAFWLHLSSFTVYNFLIGYLLLHREDHALESLAFYGVAMSLHFLVNDKALRDDHGHLYHRYGRWTLAAAALAGFAVGAATEIHELLVAAIFAFIAGGVILNVLKEELPEERDSRFSAFAAGTFGYAVLLLAI